MGIREDAEAAHAKVIEARDAEAQAKAEREATEQEAETKLTRKLIDDWAQRMGYAGQVVITDIRSTHSSSNVSTTALFHIDDINFSGHRGASKKLVVKLADDRTLGMEITDIPSLGAALAQAKRRNVY